MTDIRFLVQNLDFATGWRKDNDLLDHLAGTPKRPIVILYQEGKNLLGRHSVSRLLGKMFHGDTGDTPATAGTGIYSRGIRVRQLHLWLLGKFRDTLPRSATQGNVKVHGRRIRVISAHIAPERSGKADQYRGLRAIRRRVRSAERHHMGWIVGADWNLPVNEAARFLGGVPYGQNGGKGIVGFVCSRNVQVTRHGEDRYGLHRHETDHPAEWIDVAGVK